MLSLRRRCSLKYPSLLSFMGFLLRFPSLPHPGECGRQLFAIASHGKATTVIMVTDILVSNISLHNAKGKSLTTPSRVQVHLTSSNTYTRDLEPKSDFCSGFKESRSMFFLKNLYALSCTFHDAAKKKA